MKKPLSAFGLLFLAGCQTVVYWENLPPPRANVPVSMPKDDIETVERAVGIGQRLANARPLPVDRIWITSSYYYRKDRKITAPDAIVLMWGRCGKGTPPPSGCITLDDTYLTRMTDEALAALVAYAMATIERGVKVADFYGNERWESDDYTLARLQAAGFCAGEAMRKAGKEMVEIQGPRFGTYAFHPWQHHPPDCGPKNK